MTEMTTDQDLPAPDLDELEQRQDDALLVVPVRPVGPVGVHDLPSRTAICRNYDLTTAFERVLSGPDPKRKRALLFPSGAVWVSTSTSTGSGCKIPSTLTAPIEIRHQDAVCVRMDTGTGSVGVIVEVWAD